MSSRDLVRTWEQAGEKGRVTTAVEYVSRSKKVCLFSPAKVDNGSIVKPRYVRMLLEGDTHQRTWPFEQMGRKRSRSSHIKKIAPP